MQIQSKHFGTLMIEEGKILSFPNGIIGFPKAKKFCLLSKPEIEPYQWLHSLDQSDLAFVVVPIAYIQPDYCLRLHAQELELLGFQPHETPIMLGIVVIPENSKEATINLLAPVIIHENQKRGGQFINEHPGYCTRHLIREALRNNAREGDQHAGADTEKESIVDVRG